MSETEVQIADEPGGQPPSGAPAPYKNLWVPLFLVPAGVVMAIVLVIALFGQLAGGERSPLENLALVASGGKNEREQALMSLTIQHGENRRAAEAGQEKPWPMTGAFEQALLKVVDELDDDDRAAQVVLGRLLGEFGNPRAADELLPMLALTEGQDPDYALRFGVIEGLGMLGDPRATTAVLPFLSHDEPQLRVAAAAALANLPGEGVRAALIGGLTDSSLYVRGAAAFSLTKLDPPGYEAASVLIDMTGTTVYEAEHELDRTAFSRASGVSFNRIKALAFLAHLGREKDWAHIESLRGDPDLNVRDQVLKLLAAREEEEF